MRGGGGSQLRQFNYDIKFLEVSLSSIKMPILILDWSYL